MARKIEELAVEVQTHHRYTWQCPLCEVPFVQNGGKKIGFIIWLIREKGVKRVDKSSICGECVNKTKQ